jgi:hypothetical protein
LGAIDYKRSINIHDQVQYFIAKNKGCGSRTIHPKERLLIPLIKIT